MIKELDIYEQQRFGCRLGLACGSGFIVPFVEMFEGGR